MDAGSYLSLSLWALRGLPKQVRTVAWLPVSVPDVAHDGLDGPVLLPTNTQAGVQFFVRRRQHGIRPDPKPRRLQGHMESYKTVGPVSCCKAKGSQHNVI